ncbi:GNAT family N-acetyltransferase [Paraconexibacter algicola]|uniref:GNAT family N-acetyltransferase n=1 Tax=Paraconexibacter algicola TaxID=2133960 RepID=UPI0011B23D4D|nr:GNAT family N-acetyltransferase [Paraconexibacter algicola]
MRIDVQTSLEMRSPADLRPAAPPRIPADLTPVPPEKDDVNRRLYRGVGAAHAWTDRLSWTPERWAAWTASVTTHRALAAVHGVPCEAGFFELAVQPRGTVEIVIFGLLPDYHGLGLGGWLLTRAIEEAWALHPDGTRRVWVHTRRLDGPAALPNYRARGLRPFDALVSALP